MSQSIHHVRRSLITVSPLLACVPMMRDVAAKFREAPKADLKRVGAELLAEHAALLDSLDEHGILEPIKCYREGRRWVAVDGRHRLEWLDKRLAEEDQERIEDLQAANPDRVVIDSRSLNPRVPLIEVGKTEAERIIEASVIGRRHWTKGQRAWLGVMRHPEVCAATRQTRTDSVGTAPALAARLGVSADLVSQAVELYRRLHAPGSKPGSPAAIEAAAARAKYEHLIWGGAGLGAILAGIGGGEATVGKKKAPTGFHHLDAPLASLTRLSKCWMEWTPEERGKAQSLIAARIRGDDETPGWPAEFCLAIGEALAAAGV